MSSMSGPSPTIAEERDCSICVEKDHLSISSTDESDDKTTSSGDGNGDIHGNHDIVIFDELLAMIKLAAPVVGTYMLEMMPGVVGLILVGHIRGDNTEEIISATALAVAFLNLFAFTVGFGLSTAMDTLCSQAFGANQSQRMGVYLQTGVLVLSSLYIIVCIMFYYSTEILIFLGQPAQVAELAGQFTRYLLPGVPFVYLYELLRKVLQAQNNVLPMLYVAIISNVINVITGYFLVYYTRLGWLGVAVARVVCNISLPLMLISYVMWNSLHEKFWTGLQYHAAIRGVREFLSLGIPGMLQLCFEWWAFEMLCIICGLLPNAIIAIGSNAIILNVASNTYMFYLGLSIAGSVRIGNALGANDPKRAKIAAWLTIGMSATTATICSTLLFIFRKRIPVLFTHDDEMNELAQHLLLIGAIFQLPDAVNGALQGIFRGSGRQSLGAKLNFVAYYILGIPMGCLLAFRFHESVGGLWSGMTASLYLISVCGTVLVSLSNWENLAKQAINRTQDKETLPISVETGECQNLVNPSASNFGSFN
mmetsp:Transcript_26546/g.35449  ORF Transcript_26546/g.35449 Transcript_26546/m.35449 type:complete len:536 (+) Transcript_26546:31-1638(+)